MRQIMAKLEVAVDPAEETTTRKEQQTFWTVDKSPCWQMCHCPPQIREGCPAYANKGLACWEIEGTYCKLTMEGGKISGRDITVCQICRVYKRYGEGKPIQLKLFGVGIDRVLSSSSDKKA